MLSFNVLVWSLADPCIGRRRSTETDHLLNHSSFQLGLFKLCLLLRLLDHIYEDILNKPPSGVVSLHRLKFFVPAFFSNGQFSGYKKSEVKYYHKLESNFLSYFPT